MDSVLGTISAKLGSEALGCFCSCSLSVGWSNHAAPFLTGVVANEFHSNDNIACDKRLQVGEEGFVLVFSVELLSCVAVEAGHL